VTSATYYDGWGRAVETVTPSSALYPACTVSVTYTVYDASGRKAFVSDPFFVTLSHDTTCAPSYQQPDSTQPGTTTTYDGLGRVIKTTDALSDQTTTTYTQGAPTAGANITDTATYEATAVVDANSHQTRTLVDGLGHTRYLEHFTGTSSYALYGTVQQNYDWLGNETSVYEPNVGSGGAGLSTTAQTTTTYNLLSQASPVVDADLGTQTTTYDPNGNVTKTVNALGSHGTVYVGYDGLNRPVWRNAYSASLTGAYVTYTYDEAGHGDGVGHLTTETFNNNAGETIVKSLTGGHSYTYDERGQVTAQTDSYDGHGYPFGMAFDDAGHQTSLTFSDGEVLATSYNAQGWLSSLTTTPSGGSATTLASFIAFTSVGGAAGNPTYARIANNADYYIATFDNDLRLTSDSLTSGSTTLYSTSRGYDGVGNVVSENTALGSTANTDNQLFCYDEQNRLTWAGATGTSPCNGAVSSGTLTSAYYTQAYSYDAQGRLTSGAIGSYVYGDSSHPHAVTAIGGGTYTASYDVVGDMTCRAPNSSVTCAGTPTGATMTYDAERRLASWQNTPTTPTVQAAYLYDGEGQRIEQWVNTNGTQTTTGYLLGGQEERTNAGTITKYLGAKGLPTAIRVGTAGSLNYLASDGLGSVSVAVDASGNVVASQLYAPYGTARYNSGTMPTSKGFTGQRADATSGLDYYGARYYDPAAGQFTSADSVANGLSRYAYVGGNPETATDPSGHLITKGPGGGHGGNGCTSNLTECNGVNCAVDFSYCLVIMSGVNPNQPGSQCISGASLCANSIRKHTCAIQCPSSAGSDPNGLWSLLGDVFDSALSVTFTYADIGDMLTYLGNVKSDVADQLTVPYWIGGIITAAGIGGAFSPCSALCGGIAAVEAGFTGYTLAAQNAINSSINQIVNTLHRIQDDVTKYHSLSDPQNYEFTITAVANPNASFFSQAGNQASDYWLSETLSLSATYVTS